MAPARSRAGVVAKLLGAVRGRARTARAGGGADRTGAPWPLEAVRRPPAGGSDAHVLGPPGEPRALRALAGWVPGAPRSPGARLAARLWAAPTSAAGLLVGAAGLTRPRVRDGVLLFAPARGPAGAILGLRGFAAITLGHVVVARVEPGPRLFAHELVHTRQAERLGPLFAPAYVALHALYGYTRHPLERAARLGARRAA